MPPLICTFDIGNVAIPFNDIENVAIPYNDIENV